MKFIVFKVAVVTFILYAPSVSVSIVRVSIPELVTLTVLFFLVAVTLFTLCALARSRVPLLSFTNVTFSTLFAFSLLLPFRLVNSTLSSFAPPSMVRFGFAPATLANLKVSLPLPPFMVFIAVDAVTSAVRFPAKVDASILSTFWLVSTSKLTAPVIFTFLLSTPLIKLAWVLVVMFKFSIPLKFTPTF